VRRSRAHGRDSVRGVDDALKDPRFTAWPNGRFMERDGPLGRAAASGKKLCLVATDASLLIDLLYGLSLREDCAVVKYGTVARDGMYLGRCFLATDAATAELCEVLKHHARVMVSLQDDAFFNLHRTPSPKLDEVSSFEDWPEHALDVAFVHQQAFGRPDEAAMVAAVRESRVPTISLVAAVNRVIVGHVLLSPVSVDDHHDRRGLGLAPMAVTPERQRQGIGGALIRAALRRARLLGYGFVVVLGWPAYYARFGFVPASRFGLRYESDAPDEAFMALALREGALDGHAGVARYQPAFSSAH
jgi:putative acetyltransferase